MACANHLYRTQPQYRTRQLDMLVGCYYNHLPELDVRDLPEDANQRVEIRVLGEKLFDTRRLWRLATVWLDGLPFMVVQNAGREGDDHAQRFVTDPVLYAQAVSYLGSLRASEALSLTPTDADQELDALTCFYGHQLLELDELERSSLRSSRENTPCRVREA